jgi:putative transposase
MERTMPPAPPPVPPLLDALSQRQRSFIKYLDHGSVRTLADEARGFNWDVGTRSKIGRESKQAMEALLEELQSRSLRDVHVAAVMVDGTPVGDRTIVWALGVTVEGHKIPLGIGEGGTETSAVVATMLRGLGERDLDTRDTLWVIDGGRALSKAIRDTTRGEPAIQRCTVHKARNVVIDNLSADVREKIGPKVRKQLWQAWSETDLKVATAGLEAAAAKLERAGFDKAAQSVREGLKMTLTLQRLGVEDPGVRSSLLSTNMIESVHARVSRRKKDVKRWREPPDTMRQRITAAAVACAEQSWQTVANAPALERLSFAVMAARHKAVTLDAHIGVEPGSPIELRSIAFDAGDQRKAYPALDDLLAWSDRHGRPIDVGERALDGVAAAGNVVDALRRRGFAEADSGWARAARSGAERAVTPPLTVRGPARDRAAGDPLQALRDHLDDELLAGVADAALAAAPRMALLEPSDLEAEAGALVAATEQLAVARDDVAEWWEAECGDAARQLALERVSMTEPERRAHDPLAGGRRAVLGRATAQTLADEAARFAGQLEERDAGFRNERAREIGDPLAGLDAIARRVDALGAAVAAAREQDRRDLVASVAAEAADEAADVVGVRPTERYAELLGTRRAEQLRAAADAIASRLTDADPVRLRALHRATDPGFERLDGRRALRALRVEVVQLVNARADRETAMRAVGRWQVLASEAGGRTMQRAALEGIGRARVEAEEAGFTLAQREAERAEERTRSGGVHQLLIEQPFVALHDAVHAKLALERETATAVAELDVTASSVEM